MPGFYIRKAESKDIPYLIESSILLEQHERGDSPTALALAPDFRASLEAWFQAVIAQDESLALVADNEECPIGFALAYIAPQPNGFTVFRCHGIIQILWTNPDMRRMGVAAGLLTAIEACFTALSVPYAEISYTARNESARTFWTAQGFQVDSMTCRKFYPADASPATLNVGS
ncbi:MAG: GNAT family N-acetyltransferase [Gammaproteobacteria bacterium]|nr:GNAT family N-acetyltransferase [Gammaproteobacteria bacterium]